MANTAHFMTTGAGTPSLLVCDDRNVPIAQLELRPTVQKPEQIDPAMGDVGWIRSAEWTETSDGWLAPVVPI